MTALTRFVHYPLTVPLPLFNRAPWRERLKEQAKALEAKGHTIVWRDGVRAHAHAKALLSQHGIKVTTMGRSDKDDPAFFQAAAVAGEEAARLLEARESGRAR